jgi:hypothetical protein
MTIAALAWVTLGAAAQARECGSDAMVRAVSALAALRAAPTTDEADTDVKPDAQAQIRALKQGWIAAADARLACSAIKPDLAALQTDLQPDPGPRAGAGGPGAEVHVEQPTDYPGLMVVTLKYGLGCGDDTILLVYALSPTGIWQRVIDWHSGDYAEISGAFGDFFTWAIVPAGGSPDWRMVVAHGHPWCTSRWSGFDLDVLKPGSESGLSRSLFHLGDGYVRGDIEPKLSARRDGFDLRLQVGTGETDRMTRLGIFRYRLTGDSAERVQPIAMNGRDFVNAWLQLPWSDAARFAAPANLPALKERQDAVSGHIKSKTAESGDDFAFGPVRACSDDPHHFQVQNGGDDAPATYYQIQSGDNGFTMLAASTKPDPQCRGADLMGRK